MHAALFTIRIISTHKTNAIFQFLSGEAFLKSSSMFMQMVHVFGRMNLVL